MIGAPGAACADCGDIDHEHRDVVASPSEHRLVDETLRCALRVALGEKQVADAGRSHRPQQQRQVQLPAQQRGPQIGRDVHQYVHGDMRVGVVQRADQPGEPGVHHRFRRAEPDGAAQPGGVASAASISACNVIMRSA